MRYPLSCLIILVKVITYDDGSNKILTKPIVVIITQLFFLFFWLSKDKREWVDEIRASKPTHPKRIVFPNSLGICKLTDMDFFPGAVDMQGCACLPC